MNLIFGAVIDPNLHDEIRITVIATGFDHHGGLRQLKPSQVQSLVERQKQASGEQDEPDLETVDAEMVGAPVGEGEESAQFMPRVFDVDSLDIPAFLRRR